MAGPDVASNPSGSAANLNGRMFPKRAAAALSDEASKICRPPPPLPSALLCALMFATYGSTTNRFVCKDDETAAKVAPRPADCTAGRDDLTPRAVGAGRNAHLRL